MNNEPKMLAWVAGLQGHILTYVNRLAPQSDDVLFILDPNDQVSPDEPLSSDPIITWMSVPQTLHMLTTLAAGQQGSPVHDVTRDVQASPEDGGHWVVAVARKSLVLVSMGLTARDSDDADDDPLVEEDDDGGYLISPAGMLRALFETEPEGETRKPQVRAAVVIFKKRVHADMQAQIERKQMPDLDETLARVGNLAGFEAALEREGIANVDIVPFLTGEALS